MRSRWIRRACGANFLCRIGDILVSVYLDIPTVVGDQPVYIYCTILFQSFVVCNIKMGLLK